MSNEKKSSLEGAALKENERFVPRKRTALDGKAWWLVWDNQTRTYSTYTCFGRYRLKRSCQTAINYYEQAWGLQM